jgi:uncharacterized protein (DUF1501 family)
MSDHHHDHEDKVDPRLAAAANEGCEESRLLLSRRSVMGLSAGFFASAMIPRSALAAAGDRRLLVVILRGGMDGLQLIIPYQNSIYRQFRRDFYAQLASTKIPLRGSTASEPFAAHPKLLNFARLFNAGEASVVHAIAPPLRKRSHFQCQYNLESGGDESNPPLSSGWLNRMLMRMQSADKISTFGGELAGDACLRGMLAVGRPPLILTGGAEVRTWSNGARAARLPDSATTALLKHYRDNDGEMYKRLSNAIAVDNAAGGAAGTNVEAEFGGAGRLMAKDDGPRIGVISIDKWDNHSNLPHAISGNIELLDKSIEAFRVAIGSQWANTCVVCVSEFGRTVEINGSVSKGTEHGRAGVALLAGGALSANRFIGAPPNLQKSYDNRTSGGLMDGRFDIEPRLDTRALFTSVIYDHLDVDYTPDYDAFIFPGGSEVKPLKGIFKTTSSTYKNT